MSEISRETSVARRIEVFSARFLGLPYESNPLIGSADSPELFTISLKGFDCVTYIETVLALALASDVEDFVERLRKIRYKDGRIEWKRRNHYMTSWIRNNSPAVLITPAAARDMPAIYRERVLNVVPGLDPQRVRLKCIPKTAIPQLECHLQTGDLIFFASTCKNLDVFHAGIIVRDGSSTRMRHASRSQGGVVEQQLSEFLKANRMAGVIVARPRGSIRRRSTK